MLPETFLNELNDLSDLDYKRFYPGKVFAIVRDINVRLKDGTASENEVAFGQDIGLIAPPKDDTIQEDTPVQQDAVVQQETIDQQGQPQVATEEAVPLYGLKEEARSYNAASMSFLGTLVNATASFAGQGSWLNAVPEVVPKMLLRASDAISQGLGWLFTLGGNIGEAPVKPFEELLGEETLKGSSEGREDAIKVGEVLLPLFATTGASTAALRAGGYMSKAGGLSFMGSAAKGTVDGLIHSTLFVDPEDERLSDLVAGTWAGEDPIIEFLSSKDDDSEAMSRLKNGIESVAIDTVLNAAMSPAVRQTASRSAKFIAGKIAERLDTTKVLLRSKGPDAIQNWIEAYKAKRVSRVADIEVSVADIEARVPDIEDQGSLLDDLFPTGDDAVVNDLVNEARGLVKQEDDVVVSNLIDEARATSVATETAMEASVPSKATVVAEIEAKIAEYTALPKSANKADIVKRIEELGGSAPTGATRKQLQEHLVDMAHKEIGVTKDFRKLSAKELAEKTPVANEIVGETLSEDAAVANLVNEAKAIDGTQDNIDDLIAQARQAGAEVDEAPLDVEGLFNRMDEVAQPAVVDEVAQPAVVDEVAQPAVVDEAIESPIQDAIGPVKAIPEVTELPTSKEAVTVLLKEAGESDEVAEAASILVDMVKSGENMDNIDVYKVFTSRFVSSPKTDLGEPAVIRQLIGAVDLLGSAIKGTAEATPAAKQTIAKYMNELGIADSEAAIAAMSMSKEGADFYMNVAHPLYRSMLKRTLDSVEAMIPKVQGMTTITEETLLEFTTHMETLVHLSETVKDFSSALGRSLRALRDAPDGAKAAEAVQRSLSELDVIKAVTREAKKGSVTRAKVASKVRTIDDEIQALEKKVTKPFTVTANVRNRLAKLAEGTPEQLDKLRKLTEQIKGLKADTADQGLLEEIAKLREQIYGKAPRATKDSPELALSKLQKEAEFLDELMDATPEERVAKLAKRPAPYDTPEMTRMRELNKEKRELLKLASDLGAIGKEVTGKEAEAFKELLVLSKSFTASERAALNKTVATIGYGDIFSSLYRGSILSGPRTSFNAGLANIFGFGMDLYAKHTAVSSGATIGALAGGLPGAAVGGLLGGAAQAFFDPKGFKLAMASLQGTLSGIGTAARYISLKAGKDADGAAKLLSSTLGSTTEVREGLSSFGNIRKSVGTFTKETPYYLLKPAGALTYVLMTPAQWALNGLKVVDDLTGMVAFSSNYSYNLAKKALASVGDNVSEFGPAFKRLSDMSDPESFMEALKVAKLDEIQNMKAVADAKEASLATVQRTTMRDPLPLLNLTALSHGQRQVAQVAMSLTAPLLRTSINSVAEVWRYLPTTTATQASHRFISVWKAEGIQKAIKVMPEEAHRVLGSLAVFGTAYAIVQNLDARGATKGQDAYTIANPFGEGRLGFRGWTGAFGGLMGIIVNTREAIEKFVVNGDPESEEEAMALLGESLASAVVSIGDEEVLSGFRRLVMAASNPNFSEGIGTYVTGQVATAALPSSNAFRVLDGAVNDLDRYRVDTPVDAVRGTGLMNVLSDRSKRYVNYDAFGLPTKRPGFMGTVEDVPKTTRLLRQLNIRLEPLNPHKAKFQGVSLTMKPQHWETYNSFLRANDVSGEILKAIAPSKNIPLVERRAIVNSIMSEFREAAMEFTLGTYEDLLKEYKDNMVKTQSITQILTE